jgi:3-dehydroquinate synthase
MPAAVVVRTNRKSSSYVVEIFPRAIEEAGNWAKRVLGAKEKLCVVSNKKIFDLHGDGLLRSLRAAGFETGLHLVGDGEPYKNMKTLEGVLAEFSRFGISRTDAVIGFGGGVVGDIAGFAASIHLRGVDYLQVPTTLLAMVDSSVGGKTGINTSFGKNLAGSFYHPKGVLIDPEVLFTLPKREITAGFCECIKQGVLCGTRMLDRVAAMAGLAKVLRMHELPEGFEDFLKAQIEFKAKIVAGDEWESTDKTGSSSRKILNFGHTFAHALEKATDYKHLKHGEAVGYGILFAFQLSKKLGLLDEKVVNLLSDVVHRAGDFPRIGQIDPDEVFAALRYDKKNINNSLQWVLLKAIGKPVIVPHEDIGDSLVRSTIAKFISSN